MKLTESFAIWTIPRFFWKKNFQSNNFMTSIYDLNSLKMISKKSYLNLIKTNYKNITLELMVHPYKNSKDLFKFYKTNWNRTCVLKYRFRTT